MVIDHITWQMDSGSEPRKSANMKTKNSRRITNTQYSVPRKPDSRFLPHKPDSGFLLHTEVSH